MQIRRARHGEADAVATVWWRSRAASVPQIPAPVHSEEEVRAWFANVVLPEREVWVADDGLVVAGILVLEDDWIDQLYVDPDHIGRGVGGRLMAVAKAQRPGGLRLWTFDANVRARRFYEHHGFVPTASTTGDNEEGAADVLYEWPPPGLAPFSPDDIPECREAEAWRGRRRAHGPFRSSGPLVDERRASQHQVARAAPVGRSWAVRVSESQRL